MLQASDLGTGKFINWSTYLSLLVSEICYCLSTYLSKVSAVNYDVGSKLSTHLNLHHRGYLWHNDCYWYSKLTAVVSQRQGVVASTGGYHTVGLLFLDKLTFTLSSQHIPTPITDAVDTHTYIQTDIDRQTARQTERRTDTQTQVYSSDASVLLLLALIWNLKCYKQKPKMPNKLLK